MKVTSIGNNYIKRHPNSHSMFRGEGMCEQQLYKSDLPNSNQDKSVLTTELKQDKSVRKTADIKSSGFFNAKNAPAFGCAAAVKAPKKMGKFATAIADSPLAHKFLKLAGKNPAVFESLAALIVAGAIRPATIMSLPASTEDKKKNKKAAAHSISSGVIGLVSTVILFKPIKDAMDKLYKNPDKFGFKEGNPIFERLSLNIKGKHADPKRLKVYHDFVKFAPKLIFAPLTAAATIALIPVMDKYVLSKIFKPSVAKAEMTPMDVYRSTSFKSNIDKNKTFKSFTGGQG